MTINDANQMTRIKWQ